MLEPLVHTVDAEKIVTISCLVKSSKVTRGDLSFAVPFKLAVERNDFVHAQLLKSFITPSFIALSSLHLPFPACSTLPSPPSPFPPLQLLDISKVTRGDLSFSVPFKLVAERNDFVHALVAYFDVGFTKCHKPIGFSTGPKSRGTHWKQTVLYLEDTLTVCEGEAITGTMQVKPNEKNPCDLDTHVAIDPLVKGSSHRAGCLQHVLGGSTRRPGCDYG
ncbi:unnamed protein product [Closterium sp. NIES-53]